MNKERSSQTVLRSVRRFGKTGANRQCRSTASQSAQYPYQKQSRCIYRYQYRSWLALVDVPYRSP